MLLLPTLPSGADALSRLAQAHSDPSLPSSTRTTLSRFFSAADTLPPPGAGAISAAWYVARGRADELLPVPETWEEIKPSVEEYDGVERERVEMDVEEEKEMRRVLEEGQAVFYRYGPPIL